MVNPNADEYSIQIYSEYDGWYAQVIHLHTNAIVKSVSWNHNDFEWGVGGEKLLAELFRYLDYHVYLEDSY